MTTNKDRPDIADLYPEDKAGFAVPKAPSHSLLLLNNYMRTDLLSHIHLHLHRMRETNEPGSPLRHLSKSLERVIVDYGSINLFECVTRNPVHIDPDYEFEPKQDYLHDMRLMKHHLKIRVCSSPSIVVTKTQRQEARSTLTCD